MSTVKFDTVALQNEIDHMNKFSNTISNMIQDCVRARRSLDWDVIGEEQLEKKLTLL